MIDRRSMDKPKLRVDVVSLSSLIEDKANPRTHDEKNLEAIKASLAKFGQVEPLVIQASTGMVVGGNGRMSGTACAWVEDGRGGEARPDGRASACVERDAEPDCGVGRMGQ